MRNGTFVLFFDNIGLLLKKYNHYFWKVSVMKSGINLKTIKEKQL